MFTAAGFRHLLFGLAVGGAVLAIEFGRWHLENRRVAVRRKPGGGPAISPVFATREAAQAWGG